MLGRRRASRLRFGYRSRRHAGWLLRCCNVRKMRHIHIRRGSRNRAADRGRRAAQLGARLACAKAAGVPEVARAPHRAIVRHGAARPEPGPGEPCRPRSVLGLRGVVEARGSLQHAHRKRHEAHLARLNGAPSLRHTGARVLRIQPERDIPFAQDRQANQAPVRVPRARAGHHPHRLHVEGRCLFNGHHRGERRHGTHPPPHASHREAGGAAALARPGLHGAGGPIVDPPRSPADVAHRGVSREKHLFRRTGSI